MDGYRLLARLRLRLGLLGTIAAVSAAVGCTTTKNEKVGQMPAQPAAEKSGFLGLGGPRKFGPPPAEPVVVKPARKKGQGMRLETEIAVAETEVAAALSEDRSSVEKDQFLDAARHRYQKVLAAEPKNKVALAGLARLYEKAGDRARSAKIYQEAMQVSPKDHALAFEYGKMLFRGEQWAAAGEQFQHALSLDPENRSYHKALSYCLARNNEWVPAFTTLLKVVPEAEARYFLGRVLLDVDREPDAKQQFELALQADRSHAKSAELLAELTAPQPAAITLPETNPIQRAGYEGR